ncbi:MAG: ATP synthase F1 subunit delta [Patescibacteria group bacterium]|nr:ATP synthase F1 subunit delta [Patescibacteria group bacterium]
MRITAKQYAQALFESVSAASDNKTKAVIKSFCRVLADNNQTSQQEKIIKKFELIWDRSNNIARAEIVSARKLSRETGKILRECLKKVAAGKKIEVEEKIDKSIMGGVIMKHGDKILDASLRRRLENFREIIK